MSREQETRPPTLVERGGEHERAGWRPEEEHASSQAPPVFRVYAAVLLLGAGGFLAFAWSPLWEIGLLAALLWVAFIAAVNLLKIPMLPKVDVDVSLGGPVMLASAVVLAPPLAAAVNFAGFTNERELKRQTSIWHVMFNRSQAAITIGVAGLVAHAIGDLGWPQPLSWIAQLLGAALVYNLLNISAVAVAVVAMGKLNPRAATKGAADPFPRFATDFVLMTLMALFVVIAYEQLGTWSVLLLALPLWLGYSAMSSARESEDRAEELAIRVRELETLNKLGVQLVQARRPDHVELTTERALSEALDTEAVAVSLTGGVPDSLKSIEILGAEPAAMGVPPDLTERSSAVVRAVAGLAGMALQRLALEHELAENEKARARLSERILEEGNQERSRIALYIHDEVLPSLAAGGIQADNVRTALGTGDHAQADKLAVSVHAAVQDGITRLRQVLDDLRDQVLTPGGLRSELQSALDDLNLRSGVETRLRGPETFPPLPLAVEILVLETVRGCLANIANHAEAQHVEIDVEAGERTLSVTVADDGKGFDPAAVGEGHHGLTLMRQRVELARGQLDLGSTPGQGTRIRLEVPV